MAWGLQSIKNKVVTQTIDNIIFFKKGKKKENVTRL